MKQHPRLMPPTPAMANAIRAQVASNLKCLDDRALDLLPIMRNFEALPVYSDIGGTLFITPTGDILGIFHDEVGPEPKVEHDALWRIRAFLAAAKRYPALQVLIPRGHPRPSRAAFAMVRGELH